MYFWLSLYNPSSTQTIHHHMPIPELWKTIIRHKPAMPPSNSNFFLLFTQASSYRTCHTRISLAPFFLFRKMSAYHIIFYSFNCLRLYEGPTIKKKIFFDATFLTTLKCNDDEKIMTHIKQFFCCCCYVEIKKYLWTSIKGQQCW